jgi:tetratricopeptide (TPR) repeat protein
LEDAARALDRAVAACEAHGDLLHLASAVNNRALLTGCLGDKPGMIKDFERVIALGRHLGQDAIQIAGHYNLGEYLYLWGDVDAAMPHAEHALQLEMLRTSNSPRMEIELLPARLALYREDLAGAGKIVALIRARKRAARPAPAIDVLCSTVEYASGDVNETAWDLLEELSTRFSIGQERIEVIETRALSALRRGLVDEARGHFVRAIDAGRRIPNVMRERLERGMGALSISY